MLRVFAYLQQHPVSGIFYYRETVPAHLRPVLGKREIKKSLGTGRKTEAIRAAQLLHAETVKLFERAERRMTKRNTKPTPDPAQAAADMLAALERPSAAPSGSFGKIVLNLAGGEKVTIQRDDPAEEAAIAAKLLAAVPGAAPAPDPRRTGRPRKDAAPMLSDLIKRYFEEVKLADTQRERTIEENQAIFQLLLEVTRNPLAESIGIKQATDFKTVLLQLPANRTKGVNAGKTVAQLVKMEHKNKMSTGSVNKYLRRVSALFTWGKRHGFVHDNPFSGLAIRRKVLPHQQRERFTVEELQKLLDPANLQPDKKRGSYMYWLPWLGLYAGARLEELCQLHLEDIRQEGDLWLFDINAKDEKRLKTLSSERLVPIHPRLIELGFLSYVDGLRDRGEQRLFPELQHRRDGYGQTASKWFGRYRERLGITKPFHSLRHTFVDELHQLGEDHKKIAALVGHADESMTGGRYGKPFTPAVLHPVISRLSFPV